MRDHVTEIIRENNICVLATAAQDGPHTSLMAYVCSADVRCLYLATSRHTMKYSNLSVQPKVSLMVDTRDKDPRGKIRALTINGDAALIEDAAEADAVRAMLLNRHPYLQSLLQQPDIALLRVVIKAVQMLNGPLETYRIQFPAGSASS